jgi:hypothetical protein
MSLFPSFSPFISDTSHPRSIAAPMLSSSIVHPSFSFSSSLHASRTTHTHSTTRPHSVQIISRPTLPTHSRIPPIINPVHTRPPHRTDRFQANQRPLNISFEVLGGILATGMLLGFLRCCFNYRKTPRRDRIADILHRHHLQRELEELERNPVALRRPSLREPAPPYFPRPPSYEHMVSTHQGMAPSRVDYPAAPTYTPPSSPLMSQRIPLPTHAVTARLLPDLRPPIPSG